MTRDSVQSASGGWRSLFTGMRWGRGLQGGLAMCCLLGSCAAPPKAEAVKAPAGEVEYEYVTVLGSNIPVKVPKGSRPFSASSSPTSTMGTEESQRALLRTRAAPPRPTGAP
ncbi:MAG: hypothetical protein U1F61_10590 [Opitutaceae bacterium]